MKLSTAVKDKVVKVLGMTGSEHDGEALAALRKAARIMAENKVTWRDLIHDGVGNSSGADPWAYARGYDTGYHAGYGAALREQKEPKPRADGQPDDAELLVRLKRIDLAGFGVVLSTWEREFLSDVLDRDEARFSDKQRAIIMRILRKNGGL